MGDVVRGVDFSARRRAEHLADVTDAARRDLCRILARDGRHDIIDQVNTDIDLLRVIGAGKRRP